MSAPGFVKASAAAMIIATLGMLTAYALGVAAKPPLLQPWSCVAFLACGCVLLGERAYPERYAFPLRLLAGVVFGIGGWIWFEYSLNIDIGFDQLLFPQSLPTDAIFPGRPSSLTAFAIQLIGLTLILQRARGAAAVLFREACCLIVITLCYFAFTAYPLRMGFSAKNEFASPIASLLAVLSSICVLVIGAEGRLLPLLTDAGPAGTFARRLMPVPLLLPLVTPAVRLGLRNFGFAHGEAGNFFLSSLDILASMAIIWVSSNQVLHADRLRRKAENELRSSRDDLDRQVQLRTRELVDTADQLAIEGSRREGAQNELQQANAMLNSVIEASPLAICAFDQDGIIRKTNAAARRLLLPLEAECQTLVEKAVKGESVAVYELIRVSQGGELHLNVWASPITASNGAIIGVVMLALDVSERKALEMQIQQAQKLESLGVLAGGIAHDFNNLLTGIIGNASLLEEKFPHHTQEAAIARALLNAGDRMAKLTAQLLAYSGRARSVIELVDLSSQVSQIAGLMMASIPPNVELRLGLSETVPAIQADSGQLKQVIMSLVMNAVEAIGASRGTVEVNTQARYVRQAELAANVTQQPVEEGNYVELTVRDTGSGMPPETLARIFEPFFTTKFTGRGLGLSAVLGIVRAHRGALTVTSRPGAGATFRIFFPCREALVSSPEEQRPQKTDERGTILVVDDEVVVRDMARMALEQGGYTVITAANGQEAIAVCETATNRIDAILLDMSMPVMDGHETLMRLQSRWPYLLVVLTSGYSEEEAQSRFGHRAAGFIQKPYTVHQLVTKISGVLQKGARIRSPEGA